ncbi:MAG: hypothetical protein HYT70_01195 [Candidatus Aenigmarchaeota archaeon]|nr:hypothetical protein [Candidatus Aenigmarchaeota archaeon]
MPENKGKLLKEYEKMIREPGKYTEEQFQEIEKELSEDVHETSEGLGIEDEEKKGEEAYPEIADSIKKEADEEEDED